MSQQGRLCGWILAVGVALAGAGCGQPDVSADAAATSAAPIVETTRVVRTDLEDAIEVPGTVAGYETVAVYAKVGGYLKSIACDIGDAVTKGQVLAEIDVPEMLRDYERSAALIEQAQADLAVADANSEQVKAQHRVAESTLDEKQAAVAETEAALQFRQVEESRIRELVRDGSLSPGKLDELVYQRTSAAASLTSAQAALVTARARLEAESANLRRALADRSSAQARIRVAQAEHRRIGALLDYTSLKSPFDGVVVRRHADPGAFIQPVGDNSAAQPVLTLTRIDKVRVYLDVPMAESARLDRGDPVVFSRLPAQPGREFTGAISRYSAALHAESRMLRAEVDLDNPPDSSTQERPLKPGYYGSATVILDKQPGCLVVPASAVQVQAERSFCFTIVEGKAVQCPIRTGSRSGMDIVILKGLAEGDEVVKNAAGLSDGQAVAKKS